MQKICNKKYKSRFKLPRSEGKLNFATRKINLNINGRERKRNSEKLQDEIESPLRTLLVIDGLVCQKFWLKAVILIFLFPVLNCRLNTCSFCSKRQQL